MKTCKKNEKRFCRINFYDIGLLLKNVEFNFAIPTKLFQPSLKKYTIYVGIIYTSFLSRNLLGKNIYTVPSFIMSNMLFNGIPSNSHLSSSSLHC